MGQIARENTGGGDGKASGTDASSTGWGQALGGARWK